MKHTPGPYQIGGELIYAARGSNGSAIEIASVHSKWRDRPHSPPEAEAEANRRLFAAAPAMLEALRECITDPGACCMNTGQKTRRLAAIDAIARAAIAAAEGESST